MAHKRFLVFAYEKYDAGGGLRDLAGDYDSIPECIIGLKDNIESSDDCPDYYEVYDRIAGEEIDVAKEVADIRVEYRKAQDEKQLADARIEMQLVLSGDLNLGFQILELNGMEFDNPVPVFCKGVDLGTVILEKRPEGLYGKYDLRSTAPLPSLYPEQFQITIFDAQLDSEGIKVITKSKIERITMEIFNNDSKCKATFAQWVGNNE